MKNIYDFKASDDVAKALRVLTVVPVQQAEKAVERLADQRGDRFVTDMLSGISALKIAAWLHQKDFSTPSLLNWLLTPAKVVEVLKVMPLFWHDVHLHMTDDDLSIIITEAVNVMAALILNLEQDGKKQALLNTIAADDASLFYLYLAFYGWWPEEVYDPFFENRELEEGSPAMLFEKMRFVAPEVAGLIYDYITEAGIPARRHVMDLWLNALTFIDSQKGSDRVDEIMFKPIEIGLNVL